MKFIRSDLLNRVLTVLLIYFIIIISLLSMQFPCRKFDGL